MNNDETQKTTLKWTEKYDGCFSAREDGYEITLDPNNGYLDIYSTDYHSGTLRIETADIAQMEKRGKSSNTCDAETEDSRKTFAGNGIPADLQKNNLVKIAIFLAGLILGMVSKKR